MVRGGTVSLALITAAELFLYVNRYELCMILHGINLVFSCFYILLKKDTEVIPLTLPSTFRLINLSMPVFFSVKAYWLATVYLPMFPAFYYSSKALRHDATDIGFSLSITKNSLFLIVFGVFFSIIIGFLESKFNPASYTSSLPVIALVGAVFVSFTEEIMYRGIIQSYFEKEYGIYGIFLTIFVNTIMVPGIKLKLLAAVLATVLCAIYSKSKSLLSTTLVHWVEFMSWILFSKGF